MMTAKRGNVKLSSIGDDGLRHMVGAVSRSLLGEEEFISCRQIEEKELPQFIKNSFQALARKQVKSSAAVSIKHQEEVVFDQADLKHAHEHFLTEMQKSVIFNKSSVHSCLHNALKIRYEFLLNPRHAVDVIFFKKNNSIDKQLLLVSLENFGQGVPFWEKLYEKISVLPNDVVEKEQFVAMVTSVLQNLYSNGHRKTIVQDSKLFVDFFKFGGGNGKLPVDTSTVEQFFSSRGFDDAVGLVRQKANGGNGAWTRDEMLDLLKNVVDDTTITFNGNGNGSIHPKIIYGEDELNAKIQIEKIEKQPPGPYPSLLSFIKEDDWKFLLKRVFTKNSLDFARFIAKIDRLDKWRDAKAIIDWELEQRKVDMYAKEAVRLGDLVFAKFFQKGEYR